MLDQVGLLREQRQAPFNILFNGHFLDCTRSKTAVLAKLRRPGTCKIRRKLLQDLHVRCKLLFLI